MGFIIRDKVFLFLVILNLLVSLYIIIKHNVILGLCIIIINIILIIAGYRRYKQTSINLAQKDENISIDYISSLIPYIPLNITLRDKNDNQIATNIRKRTILEQIDIKEYLENPYISNDKKILKVKMGDIVKQYYSYRQSIKNKNNQIIGYIYFELDITDIIDDIQKMLERNKHLEFLSSQLEMQMSSEIKNRLDNQRNFQDLLDNNKDGILIFAYNISKRQVLNFMDSNSVIRNLLPSDKKDLTTFDIYDLFHISERERVETILKNMVTEKPILFETLIVDGKRVFPVEINVHLCKIHGQDAIYLSIRDITLRKELELKRDRNRILAVKNNKIDLVIYLLHCLFTRICKATKNIKEQADIIDSAYSQTKDEVRDIIHSSEFVDKTIEDLIAFYTPSNIKTYVNIKSLLETIQQTIFFKEIINNTIITTIQKGEVSEVYCDEDALKYVLIALINNSLKSIDLNKGTNFYGKIDITIEELPNYILISIEDNAGGIDKNMIDRVFDLFYSSNNGSTGLGLPTCKVIIEEILFGTIHIENVNEGVRIDIQIAK